jgi:hypothetical protein
MWRLVYGVLSESGCPSLRLSDAGVVSFLSGCISGCMSAFRREIGQFPVTLLPETIFFLVIPASLAYAYALMKLTLSTSAESVRVVNF